MPSLTIPEEALPDLQKIAGLEPANFAALVTAIGNTPPTLRPHQFQKIIASKVTSIPQDDIRAILGTTFFLFTLKDRSQISPAELSDAVANSDVVSNVENFPNEKRDILRERIALLLTFNNSLGVTAKALDVMTEHEKIFCRARILSDIRPVFSESPEKAAGAVIIHNLQIGFHRRGHHEEIYIALDTDDIQALKEVIERAEKKTNALKSLLDKSSVPYLEV